MLRKILFILWILISTCLILIFFEFGVRLYDSFSQDREKANLSESVYVQVPFLDLRLLPNIRFKDSPDIFKFFLTPFNTNEHGFRGKQFLRAKAQGVFRIICIGASTTFGHGSSSDETTFPAILEAKLNRTGMANKKFEVINAGIPGYNALQQLIIFNTEIFELEPDLVIFYTGWNDISCMFRLETSAYEKMFVGTDRFISDALVKEDKYYTRSRWAILRQIGRWRYKIDKKKMILNQGYKQVASSEERKQLMVRNIKKYLKNNYFFNRPIRIYKNCLDSMMLLAGKRGIKVCILTLPEIIKKDSPEYIYPLFNKKFPESASFLKDDFYTQMRFEVQEQFNSVIRQLAEDNHCILVDIDRVIPKTKKVLDLFCDEAHFSDKGNDFTADLIIKELAKEGIVR